MKKRINQDGKLIQSNEDLELLQLPENQLKMGSDGWRDKIFSCPPARELKGRSKPTQYHQLWSSHLGRIVGAQGRSEASAMMVLEFLSTLQLIKKYKEQPFRTVGSEFGRQIVPDYLGEGLFRELYVFEIKTARFLTNFIQKQLDENHKKFKEFGMEYIVWTDQWPLNKQTRHNLLNMRKASADHIPAKEKETLMQRMAYSKTMSVGKLNREGHSIDSVLALAWTGKLFFNITAQFTEETIISTSCREDYRDIFLGRKNSADTWWDALASN